MNVKKRAHESTVDLSSFFESLKSRKPSRKLYDLETSEITGSIDQDLRHWEIDGEIDENFFDSLALDF